jgi:hypothetical protein
MAGKRNQTGESRTEKSEMNELTFESQSGRKYRLKLADIHVRLDSWVEVVDTTNGEGEEPIYVNVSDDDQQDFRTGTGFDEFIEANPELATIITRALQKAAEKLP